MGDSFKMQVWRKTVAARRGDEAAYHWLVKMNDREVMRANTKLDTFDKYGFRTKAGTNLLALAESLYGQDRLKLSSQGITVTQMWQQTNAAYHFNRLKSSTIKGYKEARDKRIDTMARKGLFGYHLDSEGDTIQNRPPSKVKANRFVELLGKLNIDDYMDYGQSEVIVESMFEAYNRGYSLNKIQAIWDEYIAGDDFDVEAFANKLAGRKGNNYAELVELRRRNLFGI